MLVYDQKSKNEQISDNILGQIKEIRESLSHESYLTAAFELRILHEYIESFLPDDEEDQEDKEDGEKWIDILDWKQLYEQQREMSKDYKKLYDEAIKCKSS